MGHFDFAIMITLLTTPGIRLMGAARLDRKTDKEKKRRIERKRSGGGRGESVAGGFWWLQFDYKEIMEKESGYR